MSSICLLYEKEKKNAALCIPTYNKHQGYLALKFSR